MKIAVVGGGFTGLTAAYELLKLGHGVSVFEKEKQLGGLAVGWKEPGWSWSLERAYHHWFTNDGAVLSLIGELGLDPKLIIKRPITSVWWNGKMYPFDSPSTLLSFPGLPLLDKIRTAFLVAGLKLNPFWRPLEGLSVEQLFISIGGQNAWKTIWEPLLYGKFGDHAPRVSASWLWARIKKRTPSLAYMEGGFQTLVDRLEIEIHKRGGKIYTNIAIPTIKKTNAHFSILSDHFDKVLLTIPTPLVPKIAPQLNHEDFKKQLTIPHLHAQVLVLETKEPLLKHVYWLNVTDRSFPFLAVVSHTNFMDKRHYGGNHIAYIGNYLPQGHPYLSMTKEQLLKVFLPFIKKINPSKHLKIRASNAYMFIGPFAQPVHELHYSKIAPTLKTRIPGLFLANLDSIYPWDRGTNYAVELGIRAANAIHEKTL